VNVSAVEKSALQSFEYYFENILDDCTRVVERNYNISVILKHKRRNP